DKQPFLLICSIGNPEQHYKGTRHSVGHLILKEIINRQNFNQILKIGNKNYYSNENRPNLLFYESTSLMNISGKNVKDAFYNILNNSKFINYNPILIVLHDELDLKLGKIKVKKQMSSHRGHNGLKSINNNIGGGFNSISIGIDRPQSRNSNEVANYVLSKIPNNELKILTDEVVPKVETIIEEMLNGKYIYEVNETNTRKHK
ncbi:hypothetical protein PACTADRAFT_19449, partial [Pachysolen tannophilus NRRL Y-2460]